jgi:cobyrinic acid a,c-diamide synthase
LAGVILNRVSGDGHRTLLTEALAGIGVTVLGCIGRDDALTWRDRHLGLVPVEEAPAAVAASIARLAEVVAAGCDLDALQRVAASAPNLTTGSIATPRRIANVRVAIAGGPAFTFLYRDNLEALAAAGAELVAFDPLRDEHLPADIDGLLIGGGFPEVFAPRLAENRCLLGEVRAAIGTGLVTWAECGGLLWLARSLGGRDLVGTIPADGVMTDRLTLGYRHATARRTNPVVPVGEPVRGHEFHYSRVEPSGDDMRLSSRFGERLDGFASPTLLATYLHQHLGGDATPAEHFVRACATRRHTRTTR